MFFLGLAGFAGLPGLFLAFIGAADQQVPAHEGLVVEDVHGTDGIFHLLHFHKGIALGLVGAGVVNDFHGADFPDALEYVFKVAFRRFIGKVAHVKPAVGDGLLGSGNALLPVAGHAGIGVGGGFIPGGGFVVLGRADAEEAQETLPQGEFGRCFFFILGTVAAGIPAVIAIGASALVIAATGSLALSSLCVVL